MYWYVYVYYYLFFLGKYFQSVGQAKFLQLIHTHFSFHTENKRDKIDDLLKYIEERLGNSWSRERRIETISEVG